MTETSAQPHDGGSSDAKRRQAMIALIGAGVVALAAIAYFAFFKGGGSSDSNAPIARGQAKTAAGAGVAASPTSGAPTVIPAAYNGPAGRNPFKPLATPPAGQGSGSPSPSASATASPSPSASATVIVIPTLSPTPTPTKASPTPTVTVTATPSPTALPTAGQSITLTLVSVDSTAGTADVTVKQGATTTPFNDIKPGQIFGTYFKLVSILSSDPSTPPVTYGADFEYGDQFVQLATGEWSQFG
jgi:hypothetical protein